MVEFTVLTLNTWKCDGDYARRLPVLARLLARLAPDVVLLQEVFASADGKWDTGMYLAEQLGFYRVFHPARLKRRVLQGAPTDSYSGLAVLGNTIIREHQTIALPGNAADPKRWAQMLNMEFAGRSVRFVNVHLTHVTGADELRLEQVRTMVEWLHRDGSTTPTVIGGDFNAVPDDAALAWLAGQNLFALRRAAMDRPTVRDAPRCVDHLFAGGTLEILSARRVDDEAEARGIAASDHFGVLARIGLDEAGRVRR